MARFDYPFRPADVKYGNNMLTEAIMLFLSMAILVIGIIVLIIGFIFVKGSGLFASRFNSLSAFYPLYRKISIVTIIIQLLSLVMLIFDVYTYSAIWIFFTISLLCVLLECVLTAAINRIDIIKNEAIRKKMYTYCICFNAVLLIFNIIAYIYHQNTLTSVIMISIIILHIGLFILGCFYKTLIEKPFE